MNRTLRPLVLAVASLVSISALAADPHDHHGADAQKLELNDGKKGETDAPLRKGMTAIKSSIETKVKHIHSGKMTAAEFAALGKEIDKELQGIFAACKLPPAADQNLHVVLVQVMNGTRTLQDPKAKHLSGVVEIIGALDAYGKHFDHPGWANVKH